MFSISGTDWLCTGQARGHPRWPGKHADRLHLSRAEIRKISVKVFSLNTDISTTPGVAIVCPSLGGVTLPKRGTLAGELVRHDWATEVQLLKHSVIQLSYL